MHGHYWNGGCWKSLVSGSVAPANTVSEEYSSEYVESLRGAPFDDPAGMKEIVKFAEREDSPGGPATIHDADGNCVGSRSPLIPRPAGTLEIKVSSEMPPNRAIMTNGRGQSVLLEFDGPGPEYQVEVPKELIEAERESPFAKAFQEARERKLAEERIILAKASPDDLDKIGKEIK